MSKLNLVLKSTAILCSLTFALVIFSHLLVKNKTKDVLYRTTVTVPHNKVGLLLGTRKILSSGHENLYFKYRIQAAVDLYKAQKIDFVLVSGDNSQKEYDEPTDMKLDLIAQGIPAEKIYLDYAGFRTLDSVVRAKEIFGLSELTIISQAFHNERAAFIAGNKGMEVVAFNAKDVPIRYGFKTMLREKLARSKMMLDLIFGKQPKFLGDPISIK